MNMTKTVNDVAKELFESAEGFCIPEYMNGYYDFTPKWMTLARKVLEREIMARIDELNNFHNSKYSVSDFSYRIDALNNQLDELKKEAD